MPTSTIVLPDGVTFETFNEIKNYLMQWKFGSPNGSTEIISTHEFTENGSNNLNLYNSESNAFLQWESMNVGINLGWSDNAGSDEAKKRARWIVCTDGNNSSPIRYGDHVALGYGTVPSFYKYEHRTVGINLSNVESPHFEWRIIGGRVGDQVKLGDMVAIYNDSVERGGAHGDFFVRHFRTVGGNIGWTSSPDGDWVNVIIKKYGDKMADAIIAAILASV